MLNKIFFSSISRTAFCFAASLGLTASAQAMHFETRLSIDTPQGQTMEAGVESQWKMGVFNKHTDEQQVKFMKMHAKYMHLIVVSSDLSQFAHVHPYLDQETGEFSLPINTSNDDPDNIAAQTAVPTAGKYFYFNEVMPMPINEKMPMAMGRGEFVATGTEQQVEQAGQTEELKLKEHPRTVKFYQENGEDGTEGDAYKVVFSYEQFQFCSIWMPKFYVRIFKQDDTAEGGYSPVENFQKWLGMGGHSIVISKFGSKLSEKMFYHMHGFLPMSEKGKFIFPYDNHQAGVPDGQYKIWTQVKRNDTVFTFTNSFDYKNPPLDTDSLCAAPGGAS